MWFFAMRHGNSPATACSSEADFAVSFGAWTALELASYGQLLWDMDGLVINWMDYDDYEPIPY